MRILVALLAAITVFSRVSLCTAQQVRATGLLFMDEAAYQSIPLAVTPMLGQLPSQVDLSAEFPTPGDQGSQGSCVGWAVSYLKAFQEFQERRWTPWSDNHTFSPAYVYNQLNHSPDCSGGTYIFEALNLVRRAGAATHEKFPYISGACSLQPDQLVTQSAREFAIADWRRVNAQDDTEIKNNIATRFPVITGIIVDSNFAKLRGNVIYTTKGGQSLGGHALVIIGFDDARSAFKIINSWGQDWGDNGYGWINYATFRSVVREAYVAQDVVPNPVTPVITPPPKPMPIVIRAINFVRGLNVAVGKCGPYGADVLLNDTPCNSRQNAAEFDFFVPAAGNYKMIAEYASLTPRPVNVSINGVKVISGAMSAPTGCWTEDCQTLIPQGQVQLRAGPNTLRIERSDVFPHIRGIRFDPT